MASPAETLACADFELVQVVHDRASGARAIVALHDTRRGPAFGGIRRRAYPDFGAGLRDVLALATAMTWKCALADLPAGGGKVVILDHDGLDRAAAYRLVGRAVQALGGRFHTGPDVGTTAADLAVVATTTTYVARPDHDGPGDLAHSTALGVAAALRALATRLGLELPGLRIAVQGLGAVGMRLAALLHAAGARLQVADLDAALVRQAVEAFGATALAPDAILAADCEVLVPCALGPVLDADSIGRLRARAVCGAANNILADAATGRALHRRGVVVVPDFVANAGALIHGALFQLQGQAPPPARIEAIGATVTEILDRADRQQLPPGELALALARQRVERAAGTG